MKYGRILSFISKGHFENIFGSTQCKTNLLSVNVIDLHKVDLF